MDGMFLAFNGRRRVSSVPTTERTTKEDLKRGLRDIVDDDDFNHFEYAGGAIGPHHRYFLTRYAGVNAQPPEDDGACACLHVIERVFYIEHMPSRKPDGRPFLIQIGCDCIKYFVGIVRRCADCREPHRNRADNRCGPCRKARKALAKEEGPRRLAKRRAIATCWVNVMRVKGEDMDFELPDMEGMTLAELDRLHRGLRTYAAN